MSNKKLDGETVPENVYNHIVEYVDKIIGIGGRKIVRPFVKGVEYDRESYKNSIVIDNPPRHTYENAVRYFAKNKVPFFLFAPADMQEFDFGVCNIVVGAKILYGNGKVVRTSFTTNLIEGVLTIVEGKLRREIEELQKDILPEKKPTRAPEHLVTHTELLSYAEKGMQFGIPMLHSFPILRLYKGGSLIPGGALLLSDNAAKYIDRLRYPTEEKKREAMMIEEYPLSWKEEKIIHSINEHLKTINNE